MWHIWIFIEMFCADWSDSHVAESSTEFAVTASIRGIRWCIMNTSVSPHPSDLSVFLCCCLHLLPRCDSLPPSSPPPSSLNYHSISTSLPHTLTFMPFRAFLPLASPLPGSRVDPPLIPPCRIITMSPLGPTNAPCTSPTRGAAEEATTASSRRRRCSQTGLEPSTFTFTSQTGSPLLSSPTGTAHALLLQLDPEIQSRQDPQECRICVWTVSSVQLPSAADVWLLETAVGQSVPLLWQLAYCLNSLAQWDHWIIAAQSLNNVLEV